ncbi:MAG: hypothetical protein ACTHN5_10250 [Phycisphaerae bacterium]
MANQRGIGSVLIGVLVFVLTTLGVVFFLGGIAYCIFSLVDLFGRSTPPTEVFFGFIALLYGVLPGLLFLSMAAILHVMAASVRQQAAQQGILEQLKNGIQSLDVAMRIPAAPATAAPRPQPAVRPMAEESAQPLLMDLLEQVRDAALMNDTQRRQLGAIHWSKRKQTLTESIERHMLSGNWAPARLQLQELQALLPEDGEVKSLAEKVAGEYAARLSEDLRAADSQLRHLLSIAAWQEAGELVAALEHKYPGAPQVEHMRKVVQQERDAFEREHKERLLAQVSEATGKKQWQRAISAVDEFIQKYPLDKRTELLRVDLGLMQENARTQERKEQEQQFRELLKRHRYEEAIGVARALIAKYPNSQAAVELTKLLPKVEDLARQQQQQTVGPAA